MRGIGKDQFFRAGGMEVRGKAKITKSDIATIIWQDEEITRLRKREIELEGGITSIGKENDRLREKIKILERNENELWSVNV